MLAVEPEVRRLAGVPRELVEATLEARELSEGRVSARERPGTSWMEGGETETPCREEGRRRMEYGRKRSESASEAGDMEALDEAGLGGRWRRMEG